MYLDQLGIQATGLVADLLIKQGSKKTITRPRFHFILWSMLLRAKGHI